MYRYVEYIKQLSGFWLLIWCEYDTNKSYIVVNNDGKITKIEVSYIATSSVLVIKDLIKNNII